MKTYWVWVQWWWACPRRCLSVSQNILSKLVNTSRCLRCYLKPNKHNKQMQQRLPSKQAGRLRQMSNDLLKPSIQIDFLHWGEGTCCPPSGPGALCSSHTHFSFLRRISLFWAAKTHQRLPDLWRMSHIFKRNVHIKSKNKLALEIGGLCCKENIFKENNVTFPRQTWFSSKPPLPSLY